MNVTWKKRGRLVVTVCVAYYLLRWGFAEQSEGLITPEQSVSPWPLALGVGTLIVRIVGLFGVLPTCVYWFVYAIAERITKQRG